jgi:hypothetical protein
MSTQRSPLAALLHASTVSVLASIASACGSPHEPPASSAENVASPPVVPPAVDRAAPPPPARPRPWPRDVIDTNADGRPDVVVESAGSLGAGVYLGGPTLTLSDTLLGGPTLYGAFGREAVGVLDLDGNGQLDVAIPDGLGSRVLVYLVRAPVAGATQIDAPLVIDIPRGTVPIPSASVASAGDVNEDGFDDLLVGGRGTVDLYLGGSTGPATRAARFERGGAYGASVAGGLDVNGDGHVDAVVGASDEHAIYLHLGDGRGLGPPQRFDAEGRQMGDDIAMVGDVDHDGLADVVTSGFGGNGGWLFRGAREGGLHAPPISLGASGDPGFSLYVDGPGDVDGDGFDDVVAGGYAAGGAYLYRGSAEGLSTEPQRIPPLYPEQPWMYRVRGVGDVDGDGHADVALDNTMVPRTILFGSPSGLVARGVSLTARPDPTAPPPYVPPPPVVFPRVRASCRRDADCARVPERNDQCCPLCAQYFAARRDYLDEVNALCESHPGGCAISCAEGPPPEAFCVRGTCTLRPASP